MNYIVLDLEYNQPSGIRAGFKKAKYVRNEIIEIGATKLDDNLNFIKGFKCYVKPYFYPVIHPHVLNLLGFENQEYININGTKLFHAIQLFKDFVGTDDFIIIEWGNNDIPVLKQNCNVTPNTDIQWFTSKRVVNIQQNYMKYKNLKQHPSLGKVVKELNILVEENKLHHAFQDSLYTAKILQKLGKNFIEGKFPYYNFVDMPKDLLSRINTSTNCPKCGRFTKTRAIKRPIMNKDKQIETKKLSFCKECDMFINTNYYYHYKSKDIQISKKSYRATNPQAVDYIFNQYMK